MDTQYFCGRFQMKILKVADFPKLPFSYSKNLPVFYSRLMG
jgi:hypothetical protein